MSDNRVLRHWGCRHPIAQSPMGWIARSQLARAVSEAGGFGIIETSSGEIDACVAEIDIMRDSGLPFGVNLPLLLLHDDAILERILALGIKFFTTSAGDPERWLARLKDSGAVVYHSIASPKMAAKAAAAGVDGLVVEGHEGAGFKNAAAVSLLPLLREVASRHPELPLVAAGGIADGSGMAAAFAAGAEAVQMGTRFVASRESPVHDNYKKAIVAADAAGTMVVNQAGRMRMRVLRTPKAEEIGVGPMPQGTFEDIHRLYFKGRLDISVALAGQSAGIIEAVAPVAEIIEKISADFAAHGGPAPSQV